ncbi:FAD-binding oxidoreductase [Aeromonas enteropelogenes]|uniref:FAD-binding oxidoreductase n=1 Tax=Aeromonas enteropelogenes TaxID=29489 RepID=UPI003B9F77E0
MNSTVKLYSSNIEFNVAEDNTILDSALENKIMLEHSCKNGSCGLCESEVMAGYVLDSKCQQLGVGEKFLTCQCTAGSEQLTIKAEYYPELAEQVRKLVPCKVSAVELRGDFLTLKFRLPPTAQFNYLPGQFVNLIYQGITRSYSIANADVKQGIELHIRRVDNGAMSNLLFTGVKPETLMRLDGPIGTFFVRKDTRPIIFLAGGTGFAPVQAMVEQLIAQGSERSIHIYWGMNHSQDFYTKQPNQWASQHSNIRFVPVVSGDDANWTGRTGFVHQAVLQDLTDLHQYCVYACGSPVMIAAAKDDFIEQGLTSKQFFSDAFTVSK